MPLSPSQRGAPVEAVTHCAFDPAEECVWAGTDGGSLAVFSLPELSRYCCASGAHPSPLAALLPLGGAAFSASARALRVHSSGGVVRLALDEDELMPDGADTSDESLTCAAFESAAAPRVVLGRAAPFLQTFDLATGRYGPRVDAPDGACCVASSGRSLAFGSLNGAPQLQLARMILAKMTPAQGVCRFATRAPVCARRLHWQRTLVPSSRWTRAASCWSPPAWRPGAAGASALKRW